MAARRARGPSPDAGGPAIRRRTGPGSRAVTSVGVIRVSGTGTVTVKVTMTMTVTVSSLSAKWGVHIYAPGPRQHLES